MEKTLDNKYSIIVNKNKKYNPNDYKCFKYIETTSTDGRNILIEYVTNMQFNKLKEEMNTYGIKIGIKHALRDEQEQHNLYKQFCEKYGSEYADKIVCPVGTSEHHTGLAIDVEVMVDNKWVSNNDNIEISEPILRKMHPYLAKYGFILRYPKEKESITGIVYEPWHIRYVGTELAEYLNKNNLVLDEYVD